jgi:hypothetical protein
MFLINKYSFTGIQQQEKFINACMRDGRPVSTIKKNNLTLMKKDGQKATPRKNTNPTKDACSNFARLYVASQSRQINDSDFFAHENAPQPPSLAKNGSLRFGKKCDLLSCLTENESQMLQHQSSPPTECLIWDASVISHVVKPGTSKTIGDYIQNNFMKFVNHQVEKATRVDFVWDIYRSDSLKTSMRQKRGSGHRLQIKDSTLCPKQGKWEQFLKVDENKEDLFEMKAKAIAKYHPSPGKQVIATMKNNVVSVGQAVDITDLSPCTHEEADTRMFLHAQNAAQAGMKKIRIRTVDTDVVAIAVGLFPSLHVEEL